MRRVLHILTRPEDALARDVIARQKEISGIRIDVVDLNEAPDYKGLLEKIFDAHSIETW